MLFGLTPVKSPDNGRIEAKSFKNIARAPKSSSENLAYIRPKFDQLGMLRYGVQPIQFGNNITKDEIVQQKLDDIEKKEGIKILYACDAGSRAWGSDSKDSDYDIRLIYARPGCDNSKPEYFPGELNEDFDINGSNLARLLNFIRESHIRTFEWLNSPVVYRANPCLNGLKELSNNNFDKKKVASTYADVADKYYRKYIKTKEEPAPKIYLFALRYALMSEYVYKHDALPPLTFRELFDSMIEDKNIKNTAEYLLKLKKEHPEISEIGHIEELDTYLEQKIEKLKEISSHCSDSNKGSSTELDVFFAPLIGSIPDKKVTISPETIIGMKQFPNDVEYRKEILQLMGLNSNEYPLLRSIIGPQEFKQIVEEFNSSPESYSTGEHIDEETGAVIFQNARDKKYRANLHMHTLHSDGKLSVQKLLDMSAKYADRVARKQKDTPDAKSAPFTIAITDHNSVEGCKEAVEIIKNNPEKYKNLRVILGVEIGVRENSAGDYTPAKPYQIHLLAQCINPFDEKLNSVLDNTREQNENPDYASIGNLEETMDAFSNQPNCLLGYAHPLSHQSYKKAPTPQDLPVVIEKLINKFRDAAGNKACFVENYYQSYADDIGQNEGLKEQVQKSSDRLGLLSTGGLDNHGYSIFSH